MDKDEALKKVDEISRVAGVNATIAEELIDKLNN